VTRVPLQQLDAVDWPPFGEPGWPQFGPPVHIVDDDFGTDLAD